MTKLKTIAAALLTLALVATGGAVLAQQEVNSGSEFAIKKARLGSLVARQDAAKAPVRPTPARIVPAPKLRPDVEIEMLLRVAREQERAGHLDQALALTARMEVTLQEWRSKLQPAAAQTPGEALQSYIKRIAVLPGEAVTLAKESPGHRLSVEELCSLPVDQARGMLGLEDVARATAIPFPETKTIEKPAANTLTAGMQERRRVRAPAPTRAEIAANLDRKASLHLGTPTQLIEAVKLVQSAAGPEGSVPIFFELDGLRRANADLTQRVAPDVEEAPIGVALNMLLDQVGLAYQVEYGRVVIGAIRTEPPAPSRP